MKPIGILFLRMIIVGLIMLNLVLYFSEPSTVEAEPRTESLKIYYLSQHTGKGQEIRDYIVISKPTSISGTNLKRIFLRGEDGAISSVITDKEYAIGSKVKIKWLFVMVDYPLKNIASFPVIE